MLVNNQRLPRTQDMRRESFLSQGLRRKLKTYPVLVRIRIVNQVRLGIVDADAHVPVVKDVPDLVADRVVDALDVELGRERCLHAVDDGQLGVALLRSEERRVGKECRSRW